MGLDVDRLFVWVGPPLDAFADCFGLVHLANVAEPICKRLNRSVVVYDVALKIRRPLELRGQGLRQLGNVVLIIVVRQHR